MRPLAELKITEYGPPATEELIREFEQYIGRKLPEDYLLFLRQYGGGAPEIGDFRTRGGGCWGVCDFYSIGIERNSTMSLWWAYDVWSKVMGEHLVPIAFDGGGDQMALRYGDRPEPDVVVIVHEGYDVAEVADTFGEWIDSLYIDDEDLV